MKLAPLILGPGVRAHSGLPDILKFSFRQTGRVTRLRGKILGRTSGRVVGAIFVPGTFMFQGCGKSNQNLVVVVTLLVPLAGILVVGLQVSHVGDESTGVESGGLLCPLAALVLYVCKEISGCLSQIVKGEF